MTVLRDTVTTRFGGLITIGQHKEPAEAACALEAAHAAKGLIWSDLPDLWPDVRPLNDAQWSSDAARTEALIAVLDALWDWAEWTPERQQQWALQVALRTITEVLPVALDKVGLVDHAAQCRIAITLAEAARAARAAAGAALAAEAAAGAARAARAAAPVGDADEILTAACHIWIEAAA